MTAISVFRGQGDIANQLQRAALSVPNNVSERFERGTTGELITFIYYARGSAGEVRSILCVAERLDVFKNLISEISDLKSLAESISRQLRAWADSLQNTDIRGQRYLNDRSRRQYEQNKTADDFMKNLKAANEDMLRKRIEERKKAQDSEDGI